MTTAADHLEDYRDQTGLDAEEAAALLVDFFIKYGMIDSTIATLCEVIDDEGMTADFGRLLQENGLSS